MNHPFTRLFSLFSLREFLNPYSNKYRIGAMVYWTSRSFHFVRYILVDPGSKHKRNTSFLSLTWYNTTYSASLFGLDSSRAQ